MLKGSPGYELGSSSDQIMSSQKGISEDLITYQTSSYPSERFHIDIYYSYLRLKMSNRSKLLT